MAKENEPAANRGANSPGDKGCEGVVEEAALKTNIEIWRRYETAASSVAALASRNDQPKYRMVYDKEARQKVATDEVIGGITPIHIVGLINEPVPGVIGLQIEYDHSGDKQLRGVDRSGIVSDETSVLAGKKIYRVGIIRRTVPVHAGGNDFNNDKQTLYIAALDIGMPHQEVCVSVVDSILNTSYETHDAKQQRFADFEDISRKVHQSRSV